MSLLELGRICRFLAFEHQWIKERNEQIIGSKQIEQLDEYTRDLINIKHNPYYLASITNQTEELCLEAIKRNPLIFRFVRNQTEEICIEAIKQNYTALSDVKEQTLNICWEAVKTYNKIAIDSDYPILQYSAFKPLDLCFESIKKFEINFQYFPDQSPEICLEAVKINPWVIRFIDNQTKEI